jgi:hypothetical protein
MTLIFSRGRLLEKDPVDFSLCRLRITDDFFASQKFLNDTHFAILMSYSHHLLLIGATQFG